MEKADWGFIGMTTDEAAKALRIDRKTIFDAIHNHGRLPER